jgi:hypothetical protein
MQYIGHGFTPQGESATNKTLQEVTFLGGFGLLVANRDCMGISVPRLFVRAVVRFWSHGHFEKSPVPPFRISVPGLAAMVAQGARLRTMAGGLASAGTRTAAGQPLSPTQVRRHLERLGRTASLSIVSIFI